MKGKGLSMVEDINKPRSRSTDVRKRRQQESSQGLQYFSMLDQFERQLVMMYIHVYNLNASDLTLSSMMCHSSKIHK